jgi:hypothetical protein
MYETTLTVENLFSNHTSIVTIEPRAPTTIYEAPVMLVGPSTVYVVSLAWLAWGADGEVDHTLLAGAFERNMASYVDTTTVDCVPADPGTPGEGVVPCEAPYSSCVVQTKWDFTEQKYLGGVDVWNGAGTDTNRWSRPFQVYRETRHQDEQFNVVTTRNKIRGRGTALAMTMQTEELKDCKILGWNFAIGGNKYV